MMEPSLMASDTMPPNPATIRPPIPSAQLLEFSAGLGPTPLRGDACHPALQIGSPGLGTVYPQNNRLLSPAEVVLKNYIIEVLDDPIVKRGPLSSDYVENLTKTQRPDEFREVFGDNQSRRQGLWLSFLKRIRSEEVVVYSPQNKSSLVKLWYLRSGKCKDWKKSDSKRNEQFQRIDRGHLQILINHLREQPNYSCKLDSICTAKALSTPPLIPSTNALASQAASATHEGEMGRAEQHDKGVSIFHNQAVRLDDFIQWARQKKEILCEQNSNGEWVISLNPNWVGGLAHHQFSPSQMDGIRTPPTIVQPSIPARVVAEPPTPSVSANLTLVQSSAAQGPPLSVVSVTREPAPPSTSVAALNDAALQLRKSEKTLRKLYARRRNLEFQLQRAGSKVSFARQRYENIKKQLAVAEDEVKWREQLLEKLRSQQLQVSKDLSVAKRRSKKARNNWLRCAEEFKDLRVSFAATPTLNPFPVRKNAISAPTSSEATAAFAALPVVDQADGAFSRFTSAEHPQQQSFTTPTLGHQQSLVGAPPKLFPAATPAFYELYEAPSPPEIPFPRLRVGHQSFYPLTSLLVNHNTAQMLSENCPRPTNEHPNNYAA